MPVSHSSRLISICLYLVSISISIAYQYHVSGWRQISCPTDIHIPRVDKVLSRSIYVQLPRTTSMSSELYASPLDEDMALSLSAKAIELFQYTHITRDVKFTKDRLLMWEERLSNVVPELKALPNKDILLKVYSTMLSKASLAELNSLQLSSFQLMTSAIADSLVKAFPKSIAITSLVDEVTDIHLEYIESFQALTQGRESLQSIESSDAAADFKANQELLSYQYAGLCRYMYTRLSMSLGSDFDTSSASHLMRVSNWVSPVYARLQRRFMRFQAGVVEEKVDEMNNAAFDRLLQQLQVAISPKYVLDGFHVQGPASYLPSTNSPTVVVKEYPPWELASFVLKVLRNIVSSVDVSELESKVHRLFLDGLSSRMHRLMGPLEQLYSSRGLLLTAADGELVEEMLDVGHESVGALILLWHVRSNIIGTNNPEGSAVKEFLRPAMLYNSNGEVRKLTSMVESLPKDQRGNAVYEVRELTERLNPPTALESAALLATAIRDTAGEQFRSLSTYNIDLDRQSINRDRVYITVLVEVLINALSTSALREDYLYENLIAMAALEETIGVREPRSSCSEAYQSALTFAILQLMETETVDVIVDRVAGLQQRVRDIELALGMLLRLPEDDGPQVRTQALREIVNTIIRNSDAKGRNSLEDVEQNYRWIAEVLLIDPIIAKRYVAPLGLARFDKTVRGLLLNADLAISMPDLGATVEQQVLSIASNLMISADEAERRIVYLAGAVLSSLLEVGFEENQKMNYARTDAMIRKAFVMYKHPLLVRLQSKDQSRDIREVGLKISIAKLGSSFTMDLIRVLDGSRQRYLESASPTTAAAVTSSQASWGTPMLSVQPSSSTELQEILTFIQFMQSFLLRDFTSAGIISRG